MQEYAEPRESVEKRQRNIARILTGGSAGYALLAAISAHEYWHDWHQAYNNTVSHFSQISPQIVEYARNIADRASEGDIGRIAISAMLSAGLAGLAYAKHEHNRKEQPEYYGASQK